MSNDIVFLRELAKKYYELATTDENRAKVDLYKSVNDLHMQRPVILVDEIPWLEIKDEMLTCRCEDPALREYEWYLRKNIFHKLNFATDLYLPECISVTKKIEHSSIGVETIDETIYNGNINSHRYTDQFSEDEDINKLKNVIVTYDEAGTLADFEKLADAVGDILPVNIKGVYLHHYLWDDVACWRGVENLLMDLVVRPEFTHELVGRLTDIYLDKVRQYNELHLFEADIPYLHCTAGLTDYFDNKGVDKDNVTSKDLWGRGAAQIFAEVSPEMQDEFEIEYMKRAMAPFGLVYYGCCEPLDKKIHIVEKLPNLRKISITPWADVDNAAAQIGKKYVLANKPNPAFVSGNGDIDAARKEMKKIMAACKRNGCSCDIVLKDISTIGGKVENLIDWSKMAMEEALSY